MKRPEPIVPRIGQESVWDYPRPPRLEASSRHVIIRHAGEVIVDTREAYRVLETSHPPVYYVPPGSVSEHVVIGEGVSYCEWKGVARYHDIIVGSVRVPAVAWSYPTPTAGFESIRDYLAFYPRRVDECTLDGVVVTPQPGVFYGGWVTPDIVGPFKGEPGTAGW